MNMNFADINNAFSNLIQQDVTASGGHDGLEGQGVGQVFEDKLQQVVRRFDAAEKSVEDKIDSNTERVDDMVGILSGEEIGQKGSQKILSIFEKALLKISKGDLKSVTMDSQGLDALKQLLVQAGFDPEDVDGIITGLKEKAESKNLDLEQVMDGLDQLLLEGELDVLPEEVVLETSALPFISSLLETFGFSKEMVSDIVGKADRGQKGISLDVVIQELKKIETQHIQAGSSLKVQDESAFKNLLSQLNMPMPETKNSQMSLNTPMFESKNSQVSQDMPESKDSQVSLNDLLSTFEAFKQKKMDSRDLNPLQGATNSAGLNTPAGPENMTKESATALIDKLFESFNVESGKNTTLEFSFHQIKDQFKTDLLVPGKGKSAKKGLSSQTSPTGDVKSEAVFKELESILSKGSASSADNDGKGKSSEALAKDLKSETHRGAELSQGAQGNKSEFSDTLSGLKARAAEKPLPSYVTHQVERGIVRAMNRGESSLKIQLNPAELGRLTLTIDNVGSSIKVSIITESHAAREMLTANVNELRSTLSSAGISLDSFDVDMNSDFKQSMADARHQPGQSNRKNSQGKDGFNAVNSEGMDDSDANGLASTTQGESYHFVA